MSNNISSSSKLCYPDNLLAAIVENTKLELPDVFSKENQAGLHYALLTLEDREKEVLRLRYEEAYTMVTKMNLDNAEGRISDDRLSRVVADLEKEASALETKIAELNVEDPADEIQENYERFFALAKQYTYIETLDRDTLVTFVDRIEIGEKILPEGYEKMPRKNATYQQSIRIFYKFIGEIVSEPVREFVLGCPLPTGTSLSGEFNM